MSFETRSGALPKEYRDIEQDVELATVEHVQRTSLLWLLLEQRPHPLPTSCPGSCGSWRETWGKARSATLAACERAFLLG